MDLFCSGVRCVGAPKRREHVRDSRGFNRPAFGFLQEVRLCADRRQEAGLPERQDALEY